MKRLGGWIPLLAMIAGLVLSPSSAEGAAAAGLVVINDGRYNDPGLKKFAEVVEFTNYASYQLTGIPTFKLTRTDGKPLSGPLGHVAAMVEYPDDSSDLLVPGEAVHTMQMKLDELQRIASVYEKAKNLLTPYITTLSARLKTLKPDDVRVRGMWMSASDYKAMIAKAHQDEIPELDAGGTILKGVKVRGIVGDEISLTHSAGSSRVKWTQLGWAALRQLGTVSAAIRDHSGIKNWYFQFHEKLEIGGMKLAGARVTQLEGDDVTLQTEAGIVKLSMKGMSPSEIAELATRSDEVKMRRDAMLEREKAKSQAMMDYSEGLQAELKKDWATARSRYEKAYAAGHAWAGVNLAALLIAGQGGSSDEARAEEMLKEAAKGGDHIAAFNLALIRFPRLSPGSKDSDSVACLELAASKDIAMADYLLGIMYANGRGVSKDLQRSHHHLELAKSHGVI